MPIIMTERETGVREMSTQLSTAFSIPSTTQGMSFATFASAMPSSGMGAGVVGAFQARADVFQCLPWQMPVAMLAASGFARLNAVAMAPTAAIAYGMSRVAMGIPVSAGADVTRTVDVGDIHLIGAGFAPDASDEGVSFVLPVEVGAIECAGKAHIRFLSGGGAMESAHHVGPGGSSGDEESDVVSQGAVVHVDAACEGQPTQATSVEYIPTAPSAEDEDDLNTITGHHGLPRRADAVRSRSVIPAVSAGAIYNDREVKAESLPQPSPRVSIGDPVSQRNSRLRPAPDGDGLRPAPYGAGLRGNDTAGQPADKGIARPDAVRAAASVFAGRNGNPSVISSGPFDASDNVSSDAYPGGMSVELAPTDGSEHVVTTAFVGDIVVRRHYVKTDGSYVFAGWQGADESIDTALQEPNRSLRVRHDRFAGDDLYVLSVGMPGGESARQLPVPEDSDLAVEERFLAAVMEQLAGGPESLSSGSILDDFNILLRLEGRAGIFDLLAKSEWENFLKETLRLAIRYTPAFDADGARDVAEISADAAKILGIDDAQFGEWESFFGIDAMTAQLASGESPYFPGASVSDFQSMLLGGLEDGIGMRARRILPMADENSILSREDEMNIEWQVARISIIDSRIDVAYDHMMALMERDNILSAGRELALIVRHSDLDGRMSGGEFIPRWNEVEVRALVGLLMSGKAWSVVSHRAFRMHLTPRENMLVNAFIAGANVNDIGIDRIREIDVTEVTWEEFCTRMDATGRGEELLNRALQKMATAVE